MKEHIRRETHPRDWENLIIPGYSKIALVDEDCVDGYRMIPVKDFIRELLVKNQVEDRNNVAEILKAMAVPAQNCKNIMVVPLNSVLDAITNK